MRGLLLLVGMILSFAVSAQAGKPAPVPEKESTLCSKKASVAINEFFKNYVKEFREDAVAQAKEDNTEFDEADLPDGLALFGSSMDKGKEIYTYEWGERQECACGVNVVGTLTKNKKSCRSARIDHQTQSCECG